MPRVTQLPKYENTQIKTLIMEHIHDKTDRKMLYLKLVDGDTLGEIGAKVGLDYKTVWRRIHEGERELFSHLPG